MPFAKPILRTAREIISIRPCKKKKKSLMGKSTVIFLAIKFGFDIGMYV